MRKRCFFCRLLAACAALCLCLTPLTACAEQPPADARQPGVTCTDLMSDMNRQIAATLVQDMPHASCWSAAQEHVLVYGESGKETEAAAPVLAKLDLAAENYALLALTLPDIPEDLAATREAWPKRNRRFMPRLTPLHNRPAQPTTPAAPCRGITPSPPMPWSIS